MKLLSHIAIGLVILALTVGTGRETCATLQGPASGMSMVDVSSHHPTDHHDHMMPLKAAGSEHGDHQSGPSSNGDSHACLKCCAACMLGGAIHASPEYTIARAMSRVTFPSPEAQLRGHVVFVDPDIPKRVA